MKLADVDRSRMTYYLKEMRDKFVKHPESLCLRNGINAIEQRLGLPITVEAIEQRLGLPITVEAIDPMQELDRLQGDNNY